MRLSIKQARLQQQSGKLLHYDYRETMGMEAGESLGERAGDPLSAEGGFRRPSDQVRR